MHGKRILLIGENNVADMLCKVLTDAQYDVELAFDARMGRRLFDKRAFDLALIDVNLPDLKGCKLCCYLRERGAGFPLMLVSSKMYENKIDVFGSGANDYMILSDDFTELLMRIKVLVRRSPRSILAEKSIMAGDLVINLDSKKVIWGDRAITLRPKEFLLLECLAHNKSNVVSKDEIAYSIWGSRCRGKYLRIADLIKSLRIKIESGSCQKCIYNVTGKGYLLAGKDKILYDHSHQSI